jgi:ankyrin repeat protein
LHHFYRKKNTMNSPDARTTALQIASQNGHLEICRLLLTARADPHKAMGDGSTALFLAALNG